jgi:death-on-curing protein
VTGRDCAWLTPQDLLEIHDEVLSSSGGMAGLRSHGGVESLLRRVENVAHYEEVNDFVRLAAILAFAIVEGHVFNDGNKRTALIALDVFCDLNGHELSAVPIELADRLVEIADHALSLNEFQDWLRARIRKQA